MPCNSHQQLCTATRGIARPLINFKETKYLKAKKESLVEKGLDRVSHILTFYPKAALEFPKHKALGL